MRRTSIDPGGGPPSSKNVTSVASIRVAAQSAFIAVAAFAIYFSNGEFLGSFDSMPNSLLVHNLIETKTLDFDRFRESYLAKLDGRYAFVEAPNGHMTSLFPIGAAIIAAPITAVLSIVEDAKGPREPMTSVAAEHIRQRDEKLAAALLAAIAVSLFWHCARLIGTSFQAAVTTVIFAVCTPMWSIASQALWQHGPVNLTVLVLVYAVLRGARAPAQKYSWWFAVAGAADGFLPVIRPTAILFSLAALILIVRVYRARTSWFLGGILIGIAPGAAWNLSFFHSFVGGYDANLHAFHGNPIEAATALTGLLISPSRGLFVFAPVLAFAILGAVRAARLRGPAEQLVLTLGAAASALPIVYAFFGPWWAGFTYGPRFLSDTAAVASLLLIFVVPARPLSAAHRSPVGATIFVIAACASLVIEFAGANGGAAGSDWNAVPVSVDLAPARVWNVRDNQIERNLLGAYYRFIDPPRQTRDRASVVALRLEKPTPGSAGSVAAQATISDDGATPLYGFTSGRYGGQARVRVRVSDSAAAVYESWLYVEKTIAPGSRGIARGLLRIPAPPARYHLTCELVIVGGTVEADRPALVASGGSETDLTQSTQGAGPTSAERCVLPSRAPAPSGSERGPP